MESCATLIGFGILALLLSPSILQGLGVFGSEWIEESNCSALDNKPLCCDSTNYTTPCSGSFELNGLLSFIGCMIIVGKYPGHTYGISFNRSLASGLMVLIITGILFFWAYMKNKKKQKAAAAANYTPSSAVQSYETPGAAAPYGGQQFQMTEMTHTSVEHTAIEHGGFYHFITRVNVLHTVLH
ncbi:hypothetical protein ACF0H5_015464 [Mactra antiquata]